MIATATLPTDLEPLSKEGFFAHASAATIYGIQFSLYRVSGERVNSLPVCNVQYPQREPSQWVTNPNEIMHRVRVHEQPHTFGPDSTRAVAEILSLAADLCATLNEGMADKIAEAERKRKEREEQAAKARAEYEERRRQQREQWERERQERLERQRQVTAMREARAKHLYEELRWMLDSKIRLTRDGKRATVFGTIQRVNEGTNWRREVLPASHNMDIITEKGVHMNIVLADINKLEVKYDDEKRYTLLYKAGMEPAPELTTTEGS